ncbi:MAG: hypothetical protein ACMXYG_02105 [Candidatus Woesearchaeota archaeon]
MSSTDKKSDSERIEEGQILARVILEMLGAPKAHIEKTMKDYVDSLKGKTEYEIVNEHISDSEEQKDKKLFSLYAELEIWFKKPEHLMGFCFDSLPSSIEIIEPEVFKFHSNDFSGLLNDLQAKLHHLDMSLKEHNAQKTTASVIFKTLTENFIGYCLKNGKNNAKDISEITGIEQEKVQKILNDLVERKIITNKDNIYSL